MIASDLERIREQILLQAEQVNADSAARLRETAAEVASMMAGYGGDLSTVTGTLVETLQTLSVEMRRLEPRLVYQGSGQAGYQQARTGSANASAQGSEHDVVEDDSAEAMLSRFVANRRASVNMN